MKLRVFLWGGAAPPPRRPAVERGVGAAACSVYSRGPFRRDSARGRAHDDGHGAEARERRGISRGGVEGGSWMALLSALHVPRPIQ